MSMTGFTSAITISVFGTSNLSAFNAASKRLDKFAGNFEKASERVKKAGLKTMLIGAGIAASLALPALQFGKFSTQVARTGGIAEATAQQVKAIGDTAMYLGAKSSFTAQQVAEGQESLASMGLTADQVSLKTGIMADTIAFATGQQVEMADAGAMLVGTLNAYQKPMGDATRVGDLFTAAMNKSNLKFGDMQESVTNTASTMSSFGQSIETNLALLGVLSNRNEIGARAGTRLATTMTKVYTQGDKVNKVLGVNPYDKVTGKTRDFIEVFGELKDKLGTMTEEKKNVAITDLFGDDGVKVFNILLSSSREEMMGMRSAISGADGAMAAFEKRILDTPTGHWNLMKSAVDGVSMTIGGHLMPMVIQLMDGIKGVADAVFEWTRAHPMLTKFAVGFAGVAAFSLILGGALLLVGGGFMHLAALGMQLPAKLGQIAFSMGVTNSAAVPLVGSLKALGMGALKMIAPFALVGLAIYGLVKAWDTNFLGFRDTVEEVWFAIKPVVFAIWGGIKAMGQGIATVFDATLGAFWRFLSGWYEGAMSGIPPILLFAGKVAWGLGFMVGTILRAWNWIKENPIVSGLLFTSLVALTWPLIWSAVTAVWVFATQTVIAGGVAAWGFLVARAAAIKAGIAYAWSAGRAWLMNAPMMIVAGATAVWTGAQWLLNAAMTANPIGFVIALIAGLAAGVVYAYKKFDWFKNLLDGIWDAFIWYLNNVVIGAINLLIKTINLIPGVEIPIIPKIATDKAAKGAGDIATGAGGMTKAMGKADLPGSIGGMSGLGDLDAILAGAPKGAKLAAAANGGFAAGMPSDLRPARSGVGAQPSAGITNRTSTANVDRRINVAKIEITTGADAPVQDLQRGLDDFFSNLAGQEDGLEGLQYAN